MKSTFEEEAKHVDLSEVIVEPSDVRLLVADMRAARAAATNSYCGAGNACAIAIERKWWDHRWALLQVMDASELTTRNESAVHIIVKNFGELASVGGNWEQSGVPAAEQLDWLFTSLDISTFANQQDMFRKRKQHDDGGTTWLDVLRDQATW
eukprot:COSAG02_NODE_20480_length_830_cov_0.712722_1_plen_151_part_10